MISVSPSERLVAIDATFPALLPGHPHVRCLTERPGIYPPRQTVPPGKVLWSTPYPEYAPQRFDTPHILERDRTKNPQGYADPPDIHAARATRIFSSFEPMQYDDCYPINPRGRTGLAGRGKLGDYGANFAADPIVTRINRQNSTLEMIAIRRRDNGKWALPGGMVDHGERADQTAARELHEEAGVELDFVDAVGVYEGYCDDPRNTDNAWMETTVFHLHIDRQLALTPGDDADLAEWMPLTRENVDKLHANHPDFVRKAVVLWQKSSGKVVRADGVIGTAS